jgi:hypothetical protein
MKYGKLVTLTLAATVLVVMAGANAFAYTWSETDYSQITGSPSLNWVTSVPTTDTPTVYGSYVTWSNEFQNNWQYGNSYYPTLFWNNPLGNWADNPSNTALSYGSQPWKPDGSTNLFSGSGEHRITVTHKYGLSYHTNAISVSDNQYFYT